ncbi:DUF4873 domain-containing protein [Nocardioides pacificus]
MTHSDPLEEYSGHATLRAGERELDVRVHLKGAFQPIDGRFHWYGRIDRDDAVKSLASEPAVVLETSGATAACRLSDVDPWGRYRVSGTGRPPY